MNENEDYKVQIDDPKYNASNKLKNKVVIITGADSGIGAAAAILFAKEGAKVVINYLNEDKDAQNVKNIIEKYGGEAICVKNDLRNNLECKELVDTAIDSYGTINIIVNNAGTQTVQQSITDISSKQIEETFRTNMYSMFYLTQHALKHLQSGDCIINTTSVTAYRGSEELLDYSATKGAITSFTRSLSQNLASKNIRVNAVAPGPVWTPLVLDSFDNEKLSKFGRKQPLGYAAQPIEIAPSYVFLVSSF
jgi:NAD(P)-dependent dehydrogenase (short-subunit alcohol dehydrogenase family)